MIKSFDELLDKVMLLWLEQKDLAEEAEELYDKADAKLAICNDIEQKIFEMLKEMKEMDEEAFLEFLEGFEIKKEEE